jgi:hypothetical protein
VTLKDWLDIVQAIALVATAVFAALQIKAAANQLSIAAREYKEAADQTKIAANQATITAKASSATTLSNLAAASREIQWRVLQDSSLHRILNESSPAEGLTRDQKMDMAIGILISHYAFTFEFKALDQITPDIWRAFTADMHHYFNQHRVQSRWEVLKHFYSLTFREFVDRELLRRT